MKTCVQPRPEICGSSWLFIFLLLLAHSSVLGQKTVVVDSSSPYFRTVIAGAEYNRRGMHRWLWGNDYRKEWSVPVTVPVLNLDSAYGGLKPVRAGGGSQTKNLRMVDAAGRNWMLRMVNKTYLGVLPQIVQGTFVSNLANDQIASNHPYAALTVPIMSKAAGVYYASPQYYFIPYHPALGEHNAVFANSLCMLEERPDSTQIGQPSFGRPKDIVSSEVMMESVLNSNRQVVDQQWYLKSRLFDMLIGDWGRGIDNWRWAVFDSSGFTVYRAVPKDRDQTFALFEGSLLGLILRIGKFKELQSFDDEIRNVPWYNYPAYAFDKRFTNRLTLEEWLNTARAIQASVTDAVIDQALKEMPPSVYAISGSSMARKLRSRRANLVQYADAYYRFLTKEVEIPGSREREQFLVERKNDGTTVISIQRWNGQGYETRPYYRRSFTTEETRELRLYGVDGNDVFTLTGKADEGIRVRVYGGPAKDTMRDLSSVGGDSKKTRFYNDGNNEMIISPETRIQKPRYPVMSRYDYQSFKYDSRGFRPIFYYNTFYRFYVGIGYTATKNRTREGDFGSKHSVGINYSIIENSFHPYYRSSFNRLLRKWNVHLQLGYDEVRRFNYFGSGNDSKRVTDNIDYYWMRTHTIYAGAGIEQTFGGKHNLRFDLLFNGIQVIDDDEKYVSKKRGTVDPSVFGWKYFAGPQFSYSFLQTNDLVVPTKGISFQGSIGHQRSITEGKGFSRAHSFLSLYIPVYRSFSIAAKNGVATVWGEPDFYQQPNLGGFYTLRGYWRYRFWGETTFYNQNEIRWLPTVHGHLFSGRIGLVGFFDQGRVWMKGEKSSTWHTGYGAGVILVPFNRLAIAVTYGISDETKRMNIRLGKFL